ncbi:uncharacterized protein LOC117342827 [Pecten maximus]|uniref:uncharacterized protein LOC117342827 n=1 Tax=Pecten maximus TaxID=6579 RepID=UPI0014585012|nr:uncharacterized protein LOC117342827 [Pecten maximus]XP_033760980.1 uncharacterized protein LOC117342827 [Pecten maximus]
MMNPEESERMSALLSTYLERRVIGTEKTMNINRRLIVLSELFEKKDFSEFIKTGSYGEGCSIKGSDIDRMLVFTNIEGVHPDQCNNIPQHLAHKTILCIREADCRPGYVQLELVQLKQPVDAPFLKSIVRIENSFFISSDIFREEHVLSQVSSTGFKFESNGPSARYNYTEFAGADTVCCFPYNSWPKEANEWITRTRLYGWPHPTLINKIVNSGCHLVPVGDKCSDDTFLQWRISFAAAERSLVHSFSHIQVKVYVLLKYVLRQIKETLKETIGDDDILCSYFLKTIMFHAIENSSQMLWQDKNLFYCFWFCFNILIAWVKAGFCPNYVIRVNNLFQRKIHGQNQQILLEILDNYSRMKWESLSVNNFKETSILEHLCNTSMQAELLRPRTLQENIMNQDAYILPMSLYSLTFTTSSMMIGKALNLCLSQSNAEEMYTYMYVKVMDGVRCLSSGLISNGMCGNEAAAGNKAKYQRLRKCKYLMTPMALFGTEGLYLATFHFLTGNISKCLELSRRILKPASYFKKCHKLDPELCTLYKHLYHPGCTLERLQKTYIHSITFVSKYMHLPHLCLELLIGELINIPPLPYVLFLNFLCYHEIGDTGARDEALHQLIQIQYHDAQGGHKYWIVHTLLGICYQTLGDYQRAIRAYWESSQSQDPFNVKNTGIHRIAIVYLCMYVSQRSATG